MDCQVRRRKKRTMMTLHEKTEKGIAEQSRYQRAWPTYLFAQMILMIWI
jgi:hypothetical protein